MLAEYNDRKVNMKRFVLIILLGMLAGMAHATFELQDPAAQALEEQQEPGYGETKQTLGENTYCVIEVDNGECFCIHKETKDRILLTEDECAAIVSKPENIKNP
jgi:hypothetical protein